MGFCIASVYLINPRLTSSIDAIVGFFEVVGRNDRAPAWSWRARFAATMMNR